MTPTISDASDTVGITTFPTNDDVEVTDLEAESFMSIEMLRRALDIADAIGMESAEIAVVDPRDTEGQSSDGDGALVLREEGAEAAIAIAPRIRDDGGDSA